MVWCGVVWCGVVWCTLQSVAMVILIFSLSPDDQLKDFMSDGTDFVLLPEPAWEKLLSWYGLSQGSIPIPRWV